MPDVNGIIPPNITPQSVAEPQPGAEPQTPLQPIQGVSDGIAEPPANAEPPATDNGDKWADLRAIVEQQAAENAELRAAIKELSTNFGALIDSGIIGNKAVTPKAVDPDSNKLDKLF